MKYRVFLFLMILMVLGAHLLIVFKTADVSVRLWRVELMIIRGLFTPEIVGVSVAQNYLSTSLIGAVLALTGQLALLISLFIVKLRIQQRWIKIGLPCLWFSILLLGIGVDFLEMIFQSLIFLFLSIVLYILARQKRE